MTALLACTVGAAFVTASPTMHHQSGHTVAERAISRLQIQMSVDDP